MVANSSEYIVPNYANGGDAIFNQNMASSMGLPSNARKVRAASGYIPNFALTRAQSAQRAASRMDMTDVMRKINGVRFQERQASGKLTADDKAILAQKQKLDKKNIGKRSYMANKEPNKSIMLIPRRERFLMNGSDHHFMKAPYQSKAGNGLIDFFEGPSAGISKRLKKDSVEGGRFKTLLTLDGDIEKALAKGVNSIFTKFRKKAGPNAFKTSPNKITASNIKEQMEKGGPGALGAVKGATFEALMRAIVGGVSQNAKEGQLDVDFSKDEGNILDVIFGIQNKNFKFGDFKSSSSSGNKTKFAKQILNNVAGKVEVGRKAKTVNSKTAASGYIPNFAEGALEEAVGREKAAGLPVSQIRINQSGKLRNSQNPMGLAVTNTRDEPTGAIPAARGFIPNFVSGAGIQQTNFKAFADSAEKSSKALDKNTNNLKNNTSNLNKNAKTSDGLTGKLIAVQMGMSLFNSGLGEATKETDGFKGALAALGQGAIAATQVLFMMQAMGMSPGLRLGSKGAAARTAVGVRGAMTFGAKGGALNKATKGLGGMIGKLAGGFGRFIPILGTAITAFMLLNPLIKKLTGDGIIGHIGKALGLIDTPAEKAAKSLTELSRRASDALFEGGSPDFVAGKIAEIRTKAIAESEGLKVSDEDLKDPKKAFDITVEAASKVFARSNMTEMGPAFQKSQRGDANPFKKMFREASFFLPNDLKEKKIKDFKSKMDPSTQRPRAAFDKYGVLRSGPTLDEFKENLNAPIKKTLSEDQQKTLRDVQEQLSKIIFQELLSTLPQETKNNLKNQTPQEVQKLGMDQMSFLSETNQQSLTENIAAITLGKVEGKTDIELVDSYNAIEAILNNIKQKQEDITKSKGKEAGSALINTANAKAQLKSTIELRKAQLSNTTAREGEIAVAKILGTLTKGEIRNEELLLKLDQMRISNANERLSLVAEEIDKIEGVKENAGAVAAIEEKLKNVSADTVNNTEKFKTLLTQTLKPFVENDEKAKSIADRILAGAKNTDQLKKNGLDAAEALGRTTNNASNLRDVLKEAAEAASRVKILDEGDVAFAAKSRDRKLQKRELGLQDQLRGAENRNDKNAADAIRKQLADFNIEKFGTQEAKDLRIQERENSAFSAASQIISNAGITNPNVKQALEEVARGNVEFTDPDDGLEVATDVNKAFEKSLRASGTNEEDIKNALAQTDALFNMKDLMMQIEETRMTSLDISRQEQKMQEQSLKDARDQLDIDTRSVKIRLIRLNNGIQESRQAAMAQKEFEAQQSEKMGLGEKAAFAREDFKTIKDNQGLTPANALEQARLESSFRDRMKKKLVKDDKTINSDFLDKMVASSAQFRDNFVSAFAEGIKSVDDLEDALLNAADQFLKAMTTNFIDKFMDQAASEGLGGEGSKGEGSGGGGFMGFLKSAGSSIASIFGFADGGKVRGGSGSRDDVPAMLMGGEYVMNKKAVQRYGSGFMEAINSGSVRGFARGGQVRDEEGMFTTPGMNGAGKIVGMENLMSFATQTPTALGRDKLRSEGAFLDAESGRMTMFGRRNNPQFQKVQDAKRQALGLAASERAAHEQAKEQEVSLGKMLLSAAISTVVSYGTSKFLGGLEGADGEPLIGKGMTGILSSGAGNLAGTLSTDAPASGGAFGAAAASGDLMNIFSESTTKKHATGGLIPPAGGVDTVPAMLSGGEFVMNAAATKNIGAGNLQSLNSGAGTSDNTNLVSKLDELIAATETSQSTGDINITINGSNGTESQTGGEDAPERERKLSERIKVAVKQVIADEQRLGGQLRK